MLTQLNIQFLPRSARNTRSSSRMDLAPIPVGSLRMPSCLAWSSSRLNHAQGTQNLPCSFTCQIQSMRFFHWHINSNHTTAGFPHTSTILSKIAFSSAMIILAMLHRKWNRHSTIYKMLSIVEYLWWGIPRPPCVAQWESVCEWVHWRADWRRWWLYWCTESTVAFG